MARVLLPETGTPPFPTLYLLHGLSDDESTWTRQTSIERYVSDLPLIVVMPDGGRGFYLDAVEGYRYNTAIGKELVERIERTFPAKREREGRALAGLSMGGYGAAQIALSRPDDFCAAASLSGAVGVGHYSVGWDNKPYWPEVQRILGSDYIGSIPDIWHLAAYCPPESLPALRFDCGTEDFLLAHNRALHAFLEKSGVPHTYVEYAGAHRWEYWDTHIQDALAFLRPVLGI